ncbi:MAG: hypothetical protein RMI94_10490 [Bryobacterales bacterium]|nr:hypothetical protein [Bryobacteraceae bacterium]MDW8130967.1 hypothetical protein [Bryobacterales bacterium]
MRRTVRRAAGCAVLAAAALVCLQLAPIYWKAWQFRRYVAEVAARPENSEREDEWLRALLASRAAQLRLPVRSDQVRVARTRGRLELEVRYVAPVSFAFYTVDLHFRPRASGP